MCKNDLLNEIKKCELKSSLRYLNQIYTMPTGKSKALLTDIGTEEMDRVEMIDTMIYQLMSNASLEY